MSPPDRPDDPGYRLGKTFRASKRTLADVADIGGGDLGDEAPTTTSAPWATDEATRPEPTRDDPNPAENPAPGDTTPLLRVIEGSDKDRVFSLRPGRSTIGRGVDCSIVLSDIAISRTHAKIQFTGDRYQIRDLGSGNGTRINDSEEDRWHVLADGDRIELGTTKLVFEYRAPALPAAPPSGDKRRTAAISRRGQARRGRPSKKATAALPTHQRHGDKDAPFDPMSQTSFGRAVKSASRHPLWIVLGIALLSAGVGAYTLIGNRRPAEPELRGAVLINADRWGTDEAVLVARVAKNAALRSDAGAPPLDAAASAPAVATDAGGPVSTERTKPPRPAAEPAGDKTPARPRSPTAPSLDAAAEEARALASYSRGDHKAAIEILRATASGSPANAAALTRRAQLIADINEKMAVGTAANTSPDEAVAALRSAIETDSRELEGRARTVLARQASPALARIAASHMANRRYPKAYETTVAARELGATGDDGIDRVSAALERKARALYKKAHASRGKKRRQYAQEVLKIVSPKSLWFKRARRLLPRS